MISHVYIADCGSNGKNYAPTQFTQQIELTLENVNKFLFGPNGRCCTTAHFSSEGRANKNYLDSDCMFADIDCSPVDNAEEWKKLVHIKIPHIGLHVLAYPSFHNKVHLLIPFSRPVRSKEECEKVIAGTLLKLKPFFPDLDTACSDPARFSFEGAHVEDPEKWSFEWPGAPVDVDGILEDKRSAKDMKRELNGRRPFPVDASQTVSGGFKPSSSSSYLDSLYPSAHTEGMRHPTCIFAGNYIVGHSSSRQEAEERFWNFAGGEGSLPEDELRKIFEDCLSYTPLGKDLKLYSPMDQRMEKGSEGPRRKSQIIAETVVTVKKLANSELRRASHKRRESISDATDTRLDSGQIYSVHEAYPGSNCGYAIPLDSNGYKGWIDDLIVEEALDTEIEVAVKNIQHRQFGPEILNHKGLHLREANTAFFANGIFRIFPEKGAFRFEELREGQYLENAFTWKYVESPDFSAVKLAVNMLNSYFPKRPYEKTLLSVEGFAFLAFLASAVSRHVDDQRCLLIDGKGGNGKSTLREIILKVLGESIMKELPSAMLLKEGDRFSAANNGIQSASLLFADDRLPVSSKINAVSMKNLISKGPVDYEIKGGGSWTEDKLFKLLIISNQLLSFTDLTDDGLTRKLEVIEARAQMKDKNGKMPAITQEVIDSFRALLCAFLRMPQIPSEIPDNYPLREDWLKEGLQAEVFRSILIPRPGSYVEVVDIKALLAQAGDRNLGNKRLSDLENALRKNGYEVRKQRNGRKRVKGYVIDVNSTYFKIANHEGINTGCFETGEEENEEEDYKKRFEGYYKKIVSLALSYDACLKSILSGSSPVELGEGKCRYELKGVSVPKEVLFDDDLEEPQVSPSNAQIIEEPASLTPSLEAYVEEYANEPTGESTEEEWSQDEWDYYTKGVEPLPLQDRKPEVPESVQSGLSCDFNKSEPLAVEKEISSETPVTRNFDKIEPICVKDIKPWKELEIPEGCTNVPEAVSNWIGEVGVKDSGVTAVCAGKELAEKLPKEWDLEVVLKDAPTGEFRAVLEKTFYGQRE